MKSRRTPIVLIALALIFIVGLIGLWFAPANDSSMPDQLNLGMLAKDSRVEIHLRMLTSTNRTPIELLHQAIGKKLPDRTRLSWEMANPQNFRDTNTVFDLASITPKIKAASRFKVTKVTPQKAPYYAQPHVDVELQLDTSRVGRYQGEISVRVDRRRATVPVRFEVEDRSGEPRALVISPFFGYATEHGTNFNTVVSVLSKTSLRIDLVRELPSSLQGYSLVLLADAPLVRLSKDQEAMLDRFVTGGGRLIIFCNSFMSGSIAKANQLTEPFGMMVADEDLGGKRQAAEIAIDSLTENVKSLRVHRASPIQVRLEQAKRLVVGSGGDCYAAVARPVTGGEVIVVTQSLWWYWVQQHEAESDNEVLLVNLLTLTNAETGRLVAEKGRGE